MSNPSKRKGSDMETAVVGYLAATHFPDAERRVTNGAKDRGDISGVRGNVIEVKACKAFEPGPWMDEAKAEAANAGVDHYAVVAKRRNHAIAEAFAITPLWRFVELLAAEAEVEEMRTRLVKEAS